MLAGADSSALVGRRRECSAIEQLLSDVAAGRSRVAVLRGEAGVGKSALLEHLERRAAGWRIVGAAGVESELELAYSGLHQLCGPLLGHLDVLPAPQRDALATVFGQRTGPVPDRFLVGVATLSLLAVVAEEQPLICIVDDTQWLDHASLQTLGFVARRLVAERVAMVFAARTGEGEGEGDGEGVLTGLPDWHVEGLAESDARALLLGTMRAPMDAAVFARIVAESRGNPLALLELPRTWDPARLAGGFGLPVDAPVATKVERSYGRRIDQLPGDAQLLVLAAAAEPLGDLILFHRAAEVLGVDLAAAAPAIDDGLLEIGPRVTFAHPLVRSAAYSRAAESHRREVHRALAEATDPTTDPDRRAWHRALATLGLSDAVAAELECSAGRAQARGGVAAAAAFLQRAVALTMDPARRAERAVAAAEASLNAGAFDTSRELLLVAETGPLDALRRARIDLVRAHVAFASGVGCDAPPLLLRAAQQLEPFDPELARETYMTAWAAASHAGNHARGDLAAVCRAILALPARSTPPMALDLLLEGLALLVTGGHAAAAPTLQRAMEALMDIPLDAALRWGAHATGASDGVWDNAGTHALAERNAGLFRNVGALGPLLFSLIPLSHATMRSGDFAGAAVHIAEAEAIAAETGARIAPYTALRLRALQGREAEASELIASTLEQAAAERMELPASVARFAAAILYNGLGRYEEAARWARQAASEESGPFVSSRALPELVEAAARGGDVELARDALERLARTTQPCGTDFALGIEARCRALLVERDADDLYREAIDRLGRAQLRPDLARAHLLYGEWLRREGRRADARMELRRAHDLCVEIGMEAFADRARRELVATGEHVRTRVEDPRAALTPQEEQIARLARDGRTNSEIGAVLFLSPRTVEWHLRKVYAKLGVSSRSGLRTGLPGGAGEAAPE